MNKLELLVKGLILLFSEYTLNGRINSHGLIEKMLKEVMTSTKYKRKVFEAEEELNIKISTLIRSVLAGEVMADKNLRLTLELLLNEKPSLLAIIDRYTLTTTSDSTIDILKDSINGELKKIVSNKLLSQALKKLYNPATNVDMLLENVMENLTKIKKNNVVIDAALVDEIDFDNLDSVKSAATKAKELVTGGAAFKTGWDCVNTMTQGGLRRGEFITVGALRHSYKSSMVKSLMAQMVMRNKPIITDPDKKPLFMLISLEEEVDNIMFFYYTYLKYTLEEISVSESDRKHINPGDMAEYVLKNLTSMGFSIRVYRFIPEQFDFAKLQSVVEKLEQKGFEVQGIILDYVKKMSRNGVDRSGPSGTDLLNLFSMIRNYMSSRKIMFLTPHQLSTEAKQLVRNGMENEDFLNHIADKDYYADSKQLGQEIDLELFTHKGTINRKWHLFLQRGKHRIPTVISDDDQQAVLKFTDKSAPISGDRADGSTACIKNTANDDFDF